MLQPKAGQPSQKVPSQAVPLSCYLWGTSLPVLLTHDHKLST